MDPTTKDDDDERCASYGQRLNQLRLYAGQLQTGRIVPFAHRNRPVHPTLTSHDHDGDLGVAGRLHRDSDSRAVRSADLAAPGVTHRDTVAHRSTQLDC